jgi:hypothetical protein
MVAIARSCIIKEKVLVGKSQRKFQEEKKCNGTSIIYLNYTIYFIPLLTEHIRLLTFYSGLIIGDKPRIKFKQQITPSDFRRK